MENMPTMKKYFQVTTGFDHHGRKPGTHQESKILGCSMMLKDRESYKGHDFIFDMIPCENKSKPF